MSEDATCAAISDLRNNVGEVLRRADAGEEFTVTVSGRPVARLGPERARQWVSGGELRAVWETDVPQGFVEVRAP